MKLEELDYQLPPDLIAQSPVSPRDEARLLLLNRKTGALKDSVFKEIGNFFRAGDVLVFNKTKVFPARAFGKKESGGRLEVVFLTEVNECVWEVLIRGNVKDGQKIHFSDELVGEVVERLKSSYLLNINVPKIRLYEILEKIGKVPLPPYIKREAVSKDKQEYQTVFAKKTGSAAAPTAGLHFTDKLLKDLKEKGVQIEFVTLHVGLGTFAPVKTEKVENHPIHAEFFEIEKKTADSLNKAKKEGRRIIAVGTTVVRTLESAGKEGELKAEKRTTNLFIYPGYKFNVIDGLITNFHTPKSSLLALVFAFAGKDSVKETYEHAIKKRYRFFSYGDGMLIL